MRREVKVIVALHACNQVGNPLRLDRIARRVVGVVVHLLHTTIAELIQHVLQEMIDWSWIPLCWIADTVAERNRPPYMAHLIKTTIFMIDEEIFPDNE